ncbi:sensor histidine kinase [Kineococcus sp. SYSU DK006]|uniref:sensor histidine kinase n=1 Tax=Kineococcus sp. SYSU DK006 TaxID=3383127 RepID=UPI003D7E8C8E
MPVPVAAPPAPAPPDPSPRAPRSWGRTALRLLGDLALVLLCLGAGLALVGAELDGALGARVRPDAVVFADLLLGLLLTPLLVLRRRWPLPVASVLAVSTVVSASVLAASLVALFSVAARRSWRAVAIATAVLAAASLVYARLFPDPAVRWPWWAEVLVVLLLAAPVVGWGTYARTRRELLESLRRTADRLRAEQEWRAEQARVLERARIAREMHDVLAHRISAVSLHAGALAFRPDSPPEAVAAAAETIRSSSHAALEDLREILGVLRADEVTGAGGRPQPRLEHLPDLVADSAALGVDARLALRVEDPDAAPEAVQRTVYRIVQEGLTNIRKHAPGHRADVVVEGAAGGEVVVTVTDRAAPGSAPAGGSGGSGSPGGPGVPGAGFGLVGLGERVALAGGRLEHERLPDGFRLSARVPWPGRVPA